MTRPTGDPAIPDAVERAALNTALLANGTETGFWGGQGRPAPWPDDIDDWAPTTHQACVPEPGQPPF